MPAFFSCLEPNQTQTGTPIYVVRPQDWADGLVTLTDAQKTFASARNFRGETGQRVRVPDESGEIVAVLFGAGAGDKDELGPIRAGALSAMLPEGSYHFATLPDDWSENLAAIGWGLGAYKFDRYLKDKKGFPTLVINKEWGKETEKLVKAIHRGRDLINTPSSDMGPETLDSEARLLAATYGAAVEVTIGDDLLEQNLPMIHAVGRAAYEAPRLVELTWGNPEHPRLAVLGKGITFDTGGVNIKSASSARLMKKDMGGAAHALALAEMIMANELPIHLHVLLSIAENSVSGNAYRPGDVLTSRAGLTVEIDNTDAEGRLVLGDALTKAAEDNPVLMIDFATLTGAARVAVGPTLAPFYTNREQTVAGVRDLSKREYDPIWHMPLWEPYISLLSSPIADMKNSGGGFAGSVTAALFLERFVKNTPWMHLDVYGWNPTARPAHPKGGEMFALRALYYWLKEGGLKTDLS